MQNFVTKFIIFFSGVTNMALHKSTPLLLYICLTPTNNIWFWQNFASIMHHLLAIKMPNFS